MTDLSAIRAGVERIIDAVIQIDYFSAGAILGRMTGDMRPSSGDTTVPTERRLRLWKTTILCKLGHLEIKHRRALLGAGHLRLAVTDLRRARNQYRSALGSPSVRATTPDVLLRQARDAHDILAGMDAVLSERRIRLTRSALYREALPLFWMEITATPEVKAYCLRLESEAA